jgi:hypothetical protein
LTFIPVLLFASNLAAAEPPSWVAKSNAYAGPVLDNLAKYAPEMGSYLGLDRYDELVTDLKPNLYERSEADGETVLAGLKQKLGTESDPKVRQDLEIMITSSTNALESLRLKHELMLPFYNVPQDVFEGMRVLLDARNTPDRQQRALVRLKRYAGLEPGFEPITELAKARTTERFGVEALTGPYVAEVNQAIDNTDRFCAGIAQMLAVAKIEGWEEAHERLTGQLRDYSAWMKRELLPRARQTNALPEAIYTDNLKNLGVDMPPRELIERAQVGFQEIRDEMQAVAARIAQDQKLPSADYRDVIRELKKKQVTGESILPFYKERLAAIEKLVREYGIVTLPDRPANIRLASEAESAAIPAPHLQPLD